MEDDSVDRCFDVVKFMRMATIRWIGFPGILRRWWLMRMLKKLIASVYDRASVQLIGVHSVGYICKDAGVEAVIESVRSISSSSCSSITDDEQRDVL